MFFFQKWFGGHSGRNKSNTPLSRRLQVESLEGRELLAISVAYSDWSLATSGIEYSDFEISPRPLTASIATVISPKVQGETLLIEGTNNADWIEIQETESEIIVHWFVSNGTTRSSELGQQSFLKETVSTIVFNGYDGNDTFINAYNGVTCSIACRLDGGTGSNTLIGGAGNDWIYGGTGSNNVLNGGDGDNIIIAGAGNQTTFHNTGTGSNCFVTMGGSYTWAGGVTNTSASAQGDDALLVFSNKDRQGRSSYTFGGVTYTFATWTAQQVLASVATLELIYERIGSYQFFQHRHYADYAIYFCYTTNANVPFGGLTVYDSGIHFAGAATAAGSILIHEVAHLWNFGPTSYWATWGNPHPYWESFASISWVSGEREARQRSDAKSEDFAREYGRIDNWEDWTTTVTNVVMGIVPANASEKYLQKTEVVKSFFRAFNPSVSLEVLPVMTPPQLTAEGILGGVQLQWEAIPGAHGYQILRYNGDTGVWDELDYVRSTTYTDTTARTGVSERYFIRVRNSLWGWEAGSYANSNQVCVLSPPTGVTATGEGITSVSIRWDRVSNASGYRIEFSTDLDFSESTTQGVSGGATTTVNLTGLQPDTTYYVRVIATGTGNNFNSSPSEICEAKTRPLPLPVAEIHCDQTTIQDGCFTLLAGQSFWDTNLTYLWDFNGNGEYDIEGVTVWFSTDLLDTKPNAIHTIWHKVRDESGRESEPVSLDLNIVAIAPTYEVSGPNEVFAKTPTRWEFSAVASLFRPIRDWEIDWGDNSEPTRILGGPRSRISVTHYFQEPGPYTITVKTTDFDKVVTSATIGVYIVKETVMTPEWTLESEEPAAVSFVVSSPTISENRLGDYLTNLVEIMRQRQMLDLDQSPGYDRKPIIFSELLWDGELFNDEWIDFSEQKTNDFWNDIFEDNIDTCAILRLRL